MRPARLAAALSLTLVPLFSSALPLHAAPAAGYPLDVYLAQTAFEDLRVSPDGRHVAFITRTAPPAGEGFSWDVWRVDLDAAGRKTALVRLTRGGLQSSLAWSPDSRWLTFLSATDPHTGEPLLVAAPAGGEIARPVDGAPAGIEAYGWTPEGALVVAASVTPLAGQGRDVPADSGDVRRLSTEAPRLRTALYRLTLAAAGEGELSVSGAATLAEVDEAVALVRVSPDGRRLAYTTFPGPRDTDPWTAVEIYLLGARAGGDPPRRLTHNALKEGLIYAEPGLAWSRDGRRLYAVAWGREGDRFTQWRVVEVSLETGAVHNLAPGFPGSFEGLAVGPRGDIVTTATVSTRRNVFRLPPAGGAPAALSHAAGRISFFSMSRDGAVAAFVRGDRRHFPEVRVAAGLGSLDEAPAVTRFHATLEELPLPEVETVSWNNGEGDRIEGVLLWPPGRRGARDLPLMLDLHGGPWLARTEAVGIPVPSAYDPALWASRGYLVLTPNHRGSSGRGDDFLNAIRDHPCSRPAADALSGVSYLVAKGWADPRRVGVMGHSFGGMLASCLATRSDRFRAAASDAGVWDYVSEWGSAHPSPDTGFLFREPDLWRGFTSRWRESPASGAGHLTTPLLVTIGGRSQIVPPSQGHELYRALVARGVPGELLVFPGEGALIGGAGHQRTKLEAELAWFSRWLAP